LLFAGDSRCSDPESGGLSGKEPNDFKIPDWKTHLSLSIYFKRGRFKFTFVEHSLVLAHRESMIRFCASQAKLNHITNEKLFTSYSYFISFDDTLFLFSFFCI
jgi:hypothetical protein